MLLGSAGTGIILHSDKKDLLFKFIKGISKRAEARRTETAFKRSLCVYILAIISTDVINYGGDIKFDNKSSVNVSDDDELPSVAESKDKDSDDDEDIEVQPSGWWPFNLQAKEKVA